MICKSIFTVAFLLSVLFASAQLSKSDSARLLLSRRGEVNLRIALSDRADLFFLSSMVSIEKVKGFDVWATANASGFAQLEQTQLRYELLKTDSLRRNTKGYAAFTSYPSYSQSIDMLKAYASNYPQLCQLDTIGYSIKGRLIPVLKISKNVMKHEAKPQFLYTSSMHGDETGGIVLLLRLADYLLSNYGKDSYVTSLVDQLEIWINPFSNPDGTYDSNGIISQPTRYNANSYDLNRNFPDPQDGLHPDGRPYQKEVVAMMEFMNKHTFTMSANFHAGDEVLNFPWDTWGKNNSLYKDHDNHCDRDWFVHICKQYIDSVFKYYPTNYMRSVADSGYIDGYDWYRITGGRQDYTTYFLHGREVTIELDQNKTTYESQLESLWDKNYRSLLAYMQQATYGFSGLVTDSLTGNPVYAKIFVRNHDVDSSWVYTDASTGFYQRMISAGTYSLVFSAPGYQSKQIDGLSIKNDSKYELSVKLKPIDTAIDQESETSGMTMVNPVWGDDLQIASANIDPQIRYHLQLLNSLGQEVFQQRDVALDQTVNTIHLPSLPAGVYFCKLVNQNSNRISKPKSFKIIKL